MLGIKLEEGQHVFYFRYRPGGISHDEAKIVKVRTSSIRIEFLGNVVKGTKKKGQYSNVYNTMGKIFIFSKNLIEERVDLLGKVDDLIEENKELKEEVEKIHYRSDILDL